MQKENIILQGVSLNELTSLINQGLKTQLDDLSRKLLNKEDQTELLTRTEACELLKIDSSTLWAWTNKGKVKAYGISNRRYYKRTELIECLTPVK
ncbi:helix-turn-helix domain-containing protein [Psychroserpens sp. S379A]|uniref:helix-turn-helix domain-containing protein n=1 Tax=Psychroserpens sp. S379A TaxID=3415137 RepID=UPI003C7DF0AD